MTSATAATARHPLAQIVAKRGVTGVEFLRKVAHHHKALGFGTLVARKEQFSRWTRTERPATPELPTQIAIAHLLDIDVAHIYGSPWPQWLTLALQDGSAIWASPWTPVGTIHALDVAGGPVDRRGFLTAATTTTASVLAQWAMAPNSAADSVCSGQRIGSRVADLIDSGLTRLRHLDDELGSGRVFEAALAEQRMITSLLKEKSYNDTTGRRLYAAASEASRLAGWCAFDSNYIASAEHHFATALRASASSGDTASGLIATAFWANTRYACDKPDPQSALDMLDAALASAGSAGTPRTVTLLHIRRARAHSVAGQPTAAYRAIDAALASFQKADHPDADQPVLYWVSEGEIYEAAASSSLDLGDPARALSYFTAAASTSDPYDPHREPRGAAIYQARMASAHLALGDLDAALDGAHRVIALMGGVDSTRGSTTVTGLRRALARHRSIPSVASFLETTAAESD